jgi:hypothetical protein
VVGARAGEVADEHRRAGRRAAPLPQRRHGPLVEAGRAGAVVGEAKPLLRLPRGDGREQGAPRLGALALGEEEHQLAPERLGDGEAEHPLRRGVPGDDGEVRVAQDRAEGSLLEEAPERALLAGAAPGGSAVRGAPAGEVPQQVEGAAQRGARLVGAPVLRAHVPQQRAELLGGLHLRAEVSLELAAEQAVHHGPGGAARGLGPGRAMRKPCT